MAERTVEKKPFYPATCQPTAAEVSAHATRRRKWFPHHNQIWKKTKAYKEAKRYLSKPSYFGGALQITAIFLALGLGSWFGFTDVLTQAMRNGFTKADGQVLSSVPTWGVVGLLLQGALCILGFMVLSEKKKRNSCLLVTERYAEWLRKKEVSQEDLQEVLLPHYKEQCPYDPTNPDINIVLGEYFDNEAHKFGPVAHWYTLKMKGMKTGGTIVFGVTGSGKTVSVLRPVMRQSLGWMAHVSHDPENKGREKMAGFILDPKGSLAFETKAVLSSAGIDPVLDPLQVTSEGPANVTGLYYLMHEQKAARAKDGHFIFDPEIIKQYRGRLDDYLELGFDEQKVDRVWSKFQEFQDAASMVSHGKHKSEEGDGPLRRNQFTMLQPKIGDLNGLLTGGGDPKGYPTRRELAELGVFIEPINWKRNLDKITSAMVDPLGSSLDDLLRWIWVGRKDESPARGILGTIHAVSVHPMIPGSAFAMQNTLEAYAISRNQIRRYAPAKQRPTGGIDEYRDAWAAREVRLWEFKDKQVKMAKQAEAYAKMYALMQRFLGNDAQRKNQEKAEAYGTQLSRDLNLLSRPLNGLLGEASVAWEWARPLVTPSSDLQATIERIRGSLEPWMVEKFREGNFQALTVPLSEKPKPEQVDDATRKAQGGRYVTPDPVVVLATKAGELRKSEQVLVRLMVEEAGPALKAAAAETEDLKQVWAKILEDKFSRAATTPGDSRAVDFLHGALEAVRVSHGGPEDLAGDLMATVLGMPTIPTAEGRLLMKNLLKAFGDKGEEFGIQAAHGGTNPKGADLWNFIHQSSDAVADSWLKKPLGGILGVGRSYLQSLGFDEVQRDHLISDLSGALKAIADNWIHAHLACFEEVLEKEAWRERLAKIGKEGMGVFQEADKYSRMGAMVGYVDNPLATNPRDRKPQDPNVDWGSLIWSWEIGGRSAREAPFWRGTMTGADMTPLHAAQWDPVWSAIIWRLLGYSLNAAPTGLLPLAELARRGTELGVYHQAALEAFKAAVAPNIAWRTEGPFCYNPLYAPDLAPIVVAGTFNQTVFAATSDGKDSSDAFWENASFTVVFNLLQILLLVDGYASFPKIDALVTKEDTLREYLEILRARVAKRDGSPEEIEIMVNIIRWADGEWLTEASAKSETKDNIIRSLSVVTQPFKEPRFAICFAPAAKEDCSFPSWTWVMREGKVVVANLPWEKYEKVAKVVLPLANKTFQKAVQMRDGIGPVNEAIVKNNRGEIETTWRYLDELREGIAESAAERLVLGIYLGRFQNSPEMKRIAGGDHILNLWRRTIVEQSGLQNPVKCLGDVFLRQSKLGMTSAEVLLGFVAGAVGKASPYAGQYLLVPRTVQSGIEAGLFVRLLAKAKLDVPSLSQRAQDGNRTAEALLGLFQHLEAKGAAGVAPALGFQDLDELRQAARLIPGILVDEMSEVLNRGTIIRITSRLDQLTHDERMGSGSDNFDAGAGDALRPRIRLQKGYRAMRALEAQIAEMPNTVRPVLYLVDEAHFFVVGKEDAQYVSVARSANALNFYSTQSPNSLIAKMGEEVTKQFLDSLPNRVILRMPDSKTAEACAEYMGGKTFRQVYEKSISQSFDDVRMDRTTGGGRGKSEGGSVSVNVKEEERWVVELQQIVNLQAMECFAMVWDGKKNDQVRRVYTKPDYLFSSPEVRNYHRAGSKRYADLPKAYKDGEDLYALTVPRLLELGVIDASR